MRELRYMDCMVKWPGEIENLRITIKILEREDREIELETARFFLHEMKIKYLTAQAQKELI